MSTPIALLGLLAVVAFSTSCSQPIGKADTDTEFAEQLATAFKSGDYQRFEDWFAPDPNDPTKKWVIINWPLKSAFRFKPTKVTHKIISLAEARAIPGGELPGEFNGVKLRFIGRIDGVVHLRGEADAGKSELDLFIAFQRNNGAYTAPQISE